VVSTPPTPPQPPDPRRRDIFDELDDPTGMRALLSSLPDPGPMPPDLVDRITAALAAERVALEDHTVVPLQPRSHRWGRAALVAAAAAVVAVGIPAMVTGTGPGDVAAYLTRQAGGSSAASGAKAATDQRGSAQSQASAPTTSATRAAAGQAATAVYATDTAYTRSGLATQLRAFLDHPGAPAESMSSVPKAFAAAATREGLASCLKALGVTPSDHVRADYATFDGAPAILVVVGADSSAVGYALRRDCATRTVTPLAGPVTLR
jgi:negative regulator of sigma E activity